MTAGVSGVTNLLRFARSQLRATAAFAMVTRNGGEPELVFVPSDGGDVALPGEALAHVAGIATQDPEFGHAGVFVRKVQLTRAMTLVVAAVPGPGARGMLGVVGPEVDGSDRRQLDLLDRLAQRLTRHVQALHVVGERRVAFAPQPTSGMQGGRPPAPVVTDPTSAVPPGRLDSTTAAPTPPHPTSAPTAEDDRRAIGWSAAWLAPSDPITGLPSLARFFSRAGRLLGSEARASGAVAVVVVEVPSDRTAPLAARALAAQLRFGDPLARIDHGLFAAAVVLFPGSTRGEAVEERLGSAVRAALEPQAPVRTVHVLAEPGDRRDIDELLRTAIAGLPRREVASR